MNRLILIFICTLITLLPSTASTETTRLRSVIVAGTKAYQKKDYEKAASILSALKPAYQKGVRDSLMPAAFNTAGNASLKYFKYLDALEYYTIGIKVAKEMGDEDAYVACTCNVGSCYILFQDYERALYYLKKALDFGLTHHRDYTVNIASLNMARAYSRLNNAQEIQACINMTKAHPLKDKAQQQYYLAFNMSLLHAANKHYALSLKDLDTADGIIKANHLPKSMAAEVIEQRGNVYSQSDNPHSAIDCYLKLVKFSQKTEYLDQLYEGYRGLFTNYMKIGDMEESVYWQSKYVELSDSVFNMRQFNEVRNNLIKYEETVNDQHIFSLNDRIHTQRIIILLTMLLLAILIASLVIIFNYNRKLRSAYKMMVKWRNEQIAQTEAAGNEKEKPTPMSDEKYKELYQQIDKILNDIDVFSNADFSLHDLAGKVNSNTKYVSAIINNSYGKNFRSLLNEIRVREACRRLADKSYSHNLTIAAIGEEVGFKSTNNFIVVFKKIVGMTPSIYQKLSQEEKT